MQWCDEDFVRRVEIRAAELGKSLHTVTAEAGVAKEYFRKPPQHGRNVAGIFKLAEMLKTDAAVLMGLRAPDQDLAVAVSLAIAVYCTLQHCREDDIPEVVARVIKAVREEFRGKDPPEEQVPSE